MNLNLNKLKIQQYEKQQKSRKVKRDYLQDLYGTPELTMTEYN